MLNFSTLRAPPNDGDVLVEPPAERLPALVTENIARTGAMAGGLLGVDWAALRRRVRRELGAAPGAPVIMTGHQPEFMHPGVWAKGIVASRLAKALGGTAVNLIVDNDVAKTMSLPVPVRQHGGICLHHVTFADKGAGQPYEGLPAIEPEAIRRIRCKIRELMGDAYAESAMPEYLDGFERAERHSFVDQTVAGRRTLDRLFGLTVTDVRVSTVWGGPMLADWMLRAEEFAAAYNRALAEYRQEENVRNRDRPMPDLVVDDGRVELAAWAYRIGERRKRLFVERTRTLVRLFAEHEFIGAATVADLESAALPAPTDWRIRPRALTLTLWARLLASDIFIHGIGGAKYDRITNRIMRYYYGIEPPEMVCVSATLHLPLPRHGVTADDIIKARRLLRDVQYQPERLLAPHAAVEPLITAKRSAIAESERLRRSGDRSHGARREVFQRIRELNGHILACRPELLSDARARIELVERLRNEDRIAGARDYFFALFPRTRLEALCAHPQFRMSR